MTQIANNKLQNVENFDEITPKHNCINFSLTLCYGKGIHSHALHFPVGLRKYFSKNGNKGKKSADC
jgi:hypothetical protein